MMHVSRKPHIRRREPHKMRTRHAPLQHLIDVLLGNAAGQFWRERHPYPFRCLPWERRGAERMRPAPLRRGFFLSRKKPSARGARAASFAERRERTQTRHQLPCSTRLRVKSRAGRGPWGSPDRVCFISLTCAARLVGMLPFQMIFL
jgi:hypothetical protein